MRHRMWGGAVPGARRRVSRTTAASGGASPSASPSRSSSAPTSGSVACAGRRPPVTLRSRGVPRLVCSTWPMPRGQTLTTHRLDWPPPAPQSPRPARTLCGRLCSACIRCTACAHSRPDGEAATGWGVKGAACPGGPSWAPCHMARACFGAAELGSCFHTQLASRQRCRSMYVIKLCVCGLRGVLESRGRQPLGHLQYGNGPSTETQLDGQGKIEAVKHILATTG